MKPTLQSLTLLTKKNPTQLIIAVLVLTFTLGSMRANAQCFSPLSFVTEPTISVSSPYFATPGDFNGDGKIDLVVSYNTTNQVQLFLGNGDGTFAASGISIALPPTTQSRGLVSADFNGDGKMDVAIANQGASNVVILFSNGNGTFNTASANVGSGPYELATGDFNNDNKADLAVANSGTNTVSVLFNNGTGGFTSSTTLTLTGGGSSPGGITLGDFNNDGNLDWATSDQSLAYVNFAMGNGSGGFGAVGSLALPFTFSAPCNITSGDFDGDGKIDLAVENRAGGNNIYILKGNGAGGFSPVYPGSPFLGVTSPFWIIAADFNNDGKPDLASSGNATTSFSVLLNNGTGGFSSSYLSISTSGAPWSILPVDLNNDGRMDLVVSSSNFGVYLNSTATASASAPSAVCSGSSMSLTGGPASGVTYAWSGPGGFTSSIQSLAVGSPATGTYSLTVTASGPCTASASVSVTVQTTPAPVNLGSVTACGSYSIGTNTHTSSGAYTDHLTSVKGCDSAVSVNLTINPQTYTTVNKTICAGQSYTVGSTTHIDAGTYIDKVVGGGAMGCDLIQTTNLKVLFGNGGAASFSSLATASVSAYLGTSADFNNDGKLDLIFTTGSSAAVQYLKGNGDGTFAAVTSPFSTSSSSIRGMAAADFNGDGNADVAIANQNASNNVFIYLGNGSGGFTANGTVGVGSSPYNLSTGDFNNDGKPDLAVANTGGSSVTVLIGNGAGGFTTGATITTGSAPSSVTIADFNNDGNMDFATANQSTNTVSFILGNGSGGFSSSTATSLTLPFTLPGPAFITSGDYDNDGNIDLAVANRTTGNNLYILKGNGAGGFSTVFPGSPFAAGTQPLYLTTADFNGDGYPDIAAGGNNGSAVTVLTSNGSGGFNSAVSLASISNLNQVIAGDFNGDGKPDIAAAASGLSMFLNTATGLNASASATTPVCTNGTLTFTGAPGGATSYTWKGPNSFSSTLQSPAISSPTTAAAGVYTLTVSVSGACTTNATTTVVVNAPPAPVNLGSITACGSYTIGTNVHTSSGSYTDHLTSVGGCDSTVTSNLTINPLTYTTVNKTICAGQSYTVGSATHIDAGTYIDRVVGGGAMGCDLIQTTNLKVLFGNGGEAAWSYTPTLSISSPYLTTIADYNGDGKQDIISSYNTTGSVVYFQGNGDGTFAAGVTITTVAGTSGRGLVSADFNGDGKMDLAIANQVASGTVIVMYGNGNGTFGTTNSYTVGNSPYNLTTGDFNNDGKTDIVVGNTSTTTVNILLNNGSSFSVLSAITVGTGAGPGSFAVADFNHDGNMDVASANLGQSNISVLLGNGTGIFPTNNTITLPFALPNPGAIGSGDFNADGFTDLVVTNRTSGQVYILFNNGAAGFTSTTTYTTGSNTLGLVTGDFNRDGKADIVADNYGANTMTVLLGNGNTTFSTASTPATGSSPWSINSGDFNGDGIPDIVTANSGGGSLSILLGNGTGGFGPLATTSVTSYLGTSADFNNDGKLDLIFTTGSSAAVQYLKGNGDGTFAAVTSPFSTSSSSIRGMAAADFNGDGNADVAIANQNASNNVFIYLGNGSGGFTANGTVGVGSSPYNLSTGDFNNDGKPDLAVANTGGSSVTVLIGNGAGGFTTGATITTGSAPSSVTIADFNNDGNMDFATANQSTNTVSFILGNGSGGFSSSTATSLTLPFTLPGPAFITSGDYDNDGNIDLAVANRTTGNNLYILKGNGAGGFSTVFPGSPFAAGTQPLYLTTADFNGDGYPDIAAGGNNGSAVTVLTSNGSGGFNSAVSLASISNPNQVIAGDFNNDGKPDIAAAASGVSMFLNLTAKVTATANATTPVCTNGTLAFKGGPNSATSYSWSGPNSFNSASQSPTVLNPSTAYAGTYTLTVTVSGTCTASASTTVAVNTAPAPVNLGSVTACGSYSIGTITHTSSGSYTDHLTSVKGCDSAVSVNLTIKLISTHSQTLNLCAGQSATIGSATHNASGTYVDRITGGAHDGCDSIVTTNLTVFYGNGVANFSTFTNYPTSGTAGYGFTTADFNKDGIPDLATANYGNSTANILLGNGSGGFATSATVSVTNAVGVVSADFNGDGKPDLAVTSTGSTVSIFLGNGSGGFLSATPYSVNSTATGTWTPVAADFNGDGKMDLATGNGNGGSTITVLLGKGDGTFQTPRTDYSVGSSPYVIVAGDFNGDGKLDIASSNMGSGNITILRGNGDGTFNSAVLTPLTGLTSPRAISALDVNGDGILDIGVVYQNTTGAAVFLGNGTGGFGSSTALTVGSNPQFITGADFNGDGKMDMAVANYNDNTVSLFLGNGSGGFSSTSVLLGSGSGAVSSNVLPASTNPQILIAGDFNGDGKPDLAASNYGVAGVSVWLNLKSLASVTLSSNNVCTSGTGSTLTLTGPTGVSTYAWSGPNSFTSSIQIPSIINPSTAASGIYTLSVTDSHSCTATATTPAITVNQAKTFSQTITACGSLTVGSIVHTANGTYTDVLTSHGGCDSTVTTNLTILPLTFTTVNKIICAGQSYTVGTATHSASGTYIDHIAGAASNGCDIVQTTNLYVEFGSGGTPAFSYTPTLSISSPYITTIADYNGDGKQDIIASYNTTGSVVYFQGNGDGTFAAGVTITTAAGVSARGLVSADFNGDGKMDLAIANQITAGTVVVMYGNGNGTFGTTNSYTVGNSPYNLNTGDFNNDGKPDIVVGNTNTNTVNILLNNGSSFTVLSAITVGTGAGPGSFAIADFNGDGNMDIASANLGQSNISVLLGNGTGGFPTNTTITLPITLSNPGGIASGDFNADGFPDLVVNDRTNGKVLVLFNNGSAGFTSTSSITTGSNALYVITGDFNRDGKTDIVSDNYGANTMTVLLGNGNTTFTTASTPATGTSPWTINTGDFNGDGIPDIVTANSGGGNLSILLGNGAGGFGSVANASAGVYLGTSADFNNDGKLDLMYCNGSNGNVQYLKGNGDGTFAAVTSPISAPSNGVRGIVAADFNGDGNQDVAIANQGGSNIYVYLGNGAGSFTSSSAPNVGSGPYNLSVGDFNNDGKPDLAVANSGVSSVTVLIGNGSGGFTTGATINTGLNPSCIAIADFNNDGNLDFATANQGARTVSFILGNGDGTFTSSTASSITVPFTFPGPAFITSGDYDRDGNMDLAVANRAGGNNLYILKGNGAGGFSTVYPGSPFACGTNPLYLTTADFNGDGYPDIAAAGNNGSSLYILSSNGAGGFNSVITLPAPNTPYPVIAGDFNNDGKPDVTVAGSSTVYMYLNRTSSLAKQPTVTASSPICPNGTLTLTSAPGSLSGYSWSGPNFYSASGQNQSIVGPGAAGAGVYSITVTDSRGCSGWVNSSSVFTKSLPTISVTPASAVCLPVTSVALTASGSVSGYTWSPTTNLTTTNSGLTETAQISQLTFYTVAGTGANGCSNTTVVPVATVATGGVISPAFSIICSGTSKTLTVTGAAGHDYIWQISSDNSTWDTIPGATNTTYSTTSGNGLTNKFYRLMARSNSCWNVASTTAEVDISNPVIAVTATNITDNSFTLSWSPTGTGNYAISYSGTSSATQTSVTPDKTITGLTANGTYSITVTQTGVAGCSASGTLTGVNTLCAMPTGVTLSSPANAQILVSWTGVPGANYRVYYRPLFAFGYFFTKDVSGVSSALITKQGANNLYGSTTYEVYVSRLDCPTTGTVGQGTNPTNVTTLPTVSCPTPVIDSVRSLCPVQIEVFMHPGSSPTNNYNIYLQRITPTVLAVNSYGVSGNYFTINVPYSGDVYLIAADSKCTGGALSRLYVWPGNVTVKPLCTSPANLVLSNPTCNGFTASWNSDQCLSNTASGYNFYMRQAGTINYNSYGVAPTANGIGPNKKVNWLASGRNFQVFVRSVYSCNGFITYGPSSLTQTITTLSGGCRDEDTQQPEETKPAVQQYSPDNQEVFSLYPNPNTGEFAVDLSRYSTEEDAVRIEVINMIGQTVVTHLTTISGGHMSEYINLPNGTAAGTYIVRLTAGKNVYTTKINVSK